MREAVGSTLLFKVMIVFIFFFASFLAIAINYSQAFRIKNRIINIIEENEGIKNNDVRLEIINYVNFAGYYRDVDCDCSSNDYRCGNNNTNLKGSNISDSNNASNRIQGLCIKKLKNSNDEVYYRVTTFVNFHLPIVGDIFTFEVRGETKSITNDTY